MNSKDIKKLLNETMKKIDGSNDSIDINNIIERFISSIISSEFASVWVHNKNEASLFRYRDKNAVTIISMNKKVGVMTRCFLEKKSSIYNYLASEKDYDIGIDNPDNIKMKSKIILPLLKGDELIGVVTAYSSVKKIKSFDKDDMEVLKAIAPFLMNTISEMNLHSKKEINTPKPKAKPKEEPDLNINPILIQEEPEVQFEPILVDVELETKVLKKALKQDSKEIVQKVQEIEKAKKHVATPDDTLLFMSTAVHDIRTPANSLFGFLDLIEDKIEDPRLKLYVSKAKESATYINELTTSILDRISSQRDGDVAQIEIINPTKFFADVAEIFSANMHSKHISYIVYLDPLLPKTIEIDTNKLKRIVMNLIGNAYKFTPAEKSIEFSVEYNFNAKSLLVSVKDTGIGIAKESQQKIFEAFEQAEDITSLTYGGTGLGLSICASYVKELNGKLNVDSVLDSGSSFYFEIPVKVEDATPNLARLPHLRANIAILMDNKNMSCANSIVKYFAKMGVDRTKIKPIRNLNTMPIGVTNLICFQAKLDSKVLTELNKKDIKVTVVEENLFSLSGEDVDSHPVISQYGYFADTLYESLLVEQKPRVLVVDDDDISVLLIKTILEDQHCTIDSASNGEEALNMLCEAGITMPYSIVYMDNEMPIMSGRDVVVKYRQFERDNKLTPILTVSTSGNEYLDNIDIVNFDVHVGKPFNKTKIKEALNLAIN